MEAGFGRPLLLKHFKVSGRVHLVPSAYMISVWQACPQLTIMETDKLWLHRLDGSCLPQTGREAWSPVCSFPSL